MIVNLIILLLAGLSGVVLLYSPVNWKQENFRLTISFAGGFLLSISLLHILPDLFQSQLGAFKAGLFVLAGFFLLQILEFITDGAEHGHFHKHQIGQKHGFSFSIFLLLGLSIHSFLEGSILAFPENAQVAISVRNLLIGIVLHKIPASMALSSVLICSVENKTVALGYLFIFALASPAGLILSHVFELASGASDFFLILFAIVCGNFLHISTTIVFESSPEHKFNFQRLLWSLLGVGAAIIAELLN
jgi:zinc transporter ZupT